MAVSLTPEELRKNQTALSSAYQTPDGQTYYNNQIPQETAGQQATAGQKNTYTPSAQVQNAQNQMQQAQNAKPGAYQASDQVTAAQQQLQQLQQLQANKPQSYNSKYGAALDSILQQIQNPEKFNYSFDGDELFKYYADQYTQKGKQASMDAMGQAAALTGGYGNSYAQQVGNQAYDQYLLSLYDKGMDLRDRAYQQYQDQLADRYNKFNTLSQADQTDYGRYRDTVGDWENERGYYTDLYNNERNFDYGQYRDKVGDWQNERGYYTDLYNNERNFDYGQFSDQRAYDEQVRQYDTSLAEQQRQYDTSMAEQQRQFDESVRQFNESLNWEKMSDQQKYAADYAMNILAMGQMPTDAMLQAAGLSKADAEKLKAQLATGGGTGGKKTTLAAEGANGEIWKVDEYGNVERDANNKPIKVDTSKEDYLMLNGDLNNKVLSWMGMDLNQGEKKKKGNYTSY